MRKRLASRLGTPVSEIGLGCWQLGAADWGDVSEEAAFAILKASVDRGVTFIDTADVYGAGRSERLIGNFLKTLPGQGKDLFDGPLHCLFLVALGIITQISGNAHRFRDLRIVLSCT